MIESVTRMRWLFLFKLVLLKVEACLLIIMCINFIIITIHLTCRYSFLCRNQYWFQGAIVRGQ